MPSYEPIPGYSGLVQQFRDSNDSKHCTWFVFMHAAPSLSGLAPLRGSVPRGHELALGAIRHCFKDGAEMVLTGTSASSSVFYAMHQSFDTG